MGFGRRALEIVGNGLLVASLWLVDVAIRWIISNTSGQPPEGSFLRHFLDGTEWLERISVPLLIFSAFLSDVSAVPHPEERPVLSNWFSLAQVWLIALGGTAYAFAALTSGSFSQIGKYSEDDAYARTL
jgi:hypothetical protein